MSQFVRKVDEIIQRIELLQINNIPSNKDEMLVLYKLLKKLNDLSKKFDNIREDLYYRLV